MNLLLNGVPPKERVACLSSEQACLSLRKSHSVDNVAVDPGEHLGYQLQIQKTSEAKMSENTDQLKEQMESFQKIWMDTFTRMAQTAFSATPGSAPPEIIRQMRSGIFEALAKSWDEYLRSPQFMEGMKQWMDNAILFRKMTNEFFTKTRHETQDIAREDIDSVMLAVRHMEKRILDRLEELTVRLDAFDRAQTNGQSRKSSRKPAPAESTPGAGASTNSEIPPRRSARQTKAKE